MEHKRLAPALRSQQPLSVTVSAVRALFEGSNATHDVWLSLAWSAGIAIVFFVVSYSLYRRAAAT